MGFLDVRWFHNRIANGMIEGINSLVQAAKAKARGYRSIHNLKAIVCLLTGKLDLQPPASEPPTHTKQRKTKNPDPTLRQRMVCGLTVLWDLQAIDTDNWKDGWFYNPDDGRTSRAAAELHSVDTLMAPTYVGVPLIGTTKTPLRVPQHSIEWLC